MKQKLPLIWILLFAFLISGCRENYLAEKAFYQANKTLKNVNQADLKANPETALAPAIQAFEKVADKYPTSSKAPESLFTISDLYVKAKKFDEARKALAKVVQNFTGRGELAANARFRMAQLYEMQGFWTKAEKAYWETAEYHPLENKGLYAPFYILLHYKQAKDEVNQADAYQRAVEYYKRTLRETGPIEVSATIRNSLALAHFSQGKLAEARQEWLAIAEDFPKNPYAPLALLTIADLSWREKNYDKAFEDYSYFFERYPKHPVAGKTAVHLGLLYQTQKQFAKSREWLERAIREYFQDSPAGIADLKLLIGKAYQDEGLWDEADKVYQELETKYPETSATLQVPLVRYIHYNGLGETEKASQVLDQAIEHYKKLVAKQPNSQLAAFAKKFMFEAYTKKKDWNQLLVNADQELKNEKIEERKGRWLFLKALIAENRLKDKERALALYQDFLTQYPGHPLSQLAKSHQEILSKA